MSEIKTYRCDECKCHLPTGPHGEPLGITEFYGDIVIDFTCGLVGVNKKNAHYGAELGKLDFCNLECMTSYIAFELTEHFVDVCGGETNEEKSVPETHGDECGCSECLAENTARHNGSRDPGYLKWKEENGLK